MKSSAKGSLGALLLNAVLVVAGASAAGAVTLVNRDDKDHKLTVIEDAGAKTSELNLKPSQVLEGFCEKGCVIRINDNEEDEYELQPGDKVSIEEGYLYYDDPEGGAPAAGTAPTAPSAPKQ